MRSGLTATASFWPEIETAFAWVHRAAHILANPAEDDATQVAARYDGLLREMAQQRQSLSALAPAVDHFLKVTDSYRPGLFHCYRVPGLPPTNNDLEHYFGTGRYLERRATGRKRAGATFVIRGPVRLVASVATHLRPFEVDELVPVDPDKWKALRRTLDARHETRRAQRRFRRDRHAYLQGLEDQLLKSALPS